MHEHEPATPRVLAQEQAIRAIAIAYPEAHEDFPWGERALKVRGKVFLFMYASAQGIGLSVKLPRSNESALDLPFTKPTGYGLGKSGWVSASFDANDDVPLKLVRDWIDESYRAVAPKKLVATLDAPTTPRTSSAPETATRTPPKQPRRTTAGTEASRAAPAKKPSRTKAATPARKAKRPSR